MRGLNILYSGDSNNLEEQEQKQKQNIMRHHHFIVNKNYDRTIMKKVGSFRTTIQQQNQNQLEEQIDNNSIKILSSFSPLTKIRGFTMQA